MGAPLAPALPGYDSPELIAHGATALVFRAVQAKLNRLVAIKVLMANTGSVPGNAGRELAMTVALSSHPHIVSIIDTGVTEDDRHYIVMEYFDGGSYAQILRHQGPLPVDDVVEVGIKIGEALHAAHEVGIVHRDVKPSNILRSRFGPALTDFGIARAPDELGGTLTREMMTPHHASPEALVHQAQSGSSDVYSLASTMWTLLVGHPPFVDPTMPAVDIYAFRDRVRHDPVATMPREDVPAWLAAELARAMSKLPSQRHDSAFEFAESLRRGTLGLAATPASSTDGPMPAQLHGAVRVAARPAGAWPDAGPTDSHVPDEKAAAPASAPDAAVASDVAPSPQTTEPEPFVSPAETPPDTHTADHGGWQSRAANIETEQPAAVSLIPDRGRAAWKGGRAVLATVLVGVVMIVVAGVGYVLFGGRDRQVASDRIAMPTPGPTRFITPVSEGAPRNVRLSDRGASVTLSWTDPTEGAVQFLVTGATSAGRALPVRNIPRGTTTAWYAGLDPTMNYCFYVAAVYTVDKVARAPHICTSR